MPSSMGIVPNHNSSMRHSEGTGICQSDSPGEHIPIITYHCCCRILTSFCSCKTDSLEGIGNGCNIQTVDIGWCKSVRHFLGRFEEKNIPEENLSIVSIRLRKFLQQKFIFQECNGEDTWNFFGLLNALVGWWLPACLESISMRSTGLS